MIVDGAKARWETVTAFEAKKNDVDVRVLEGRI
jgi:hypothetical protein